MTWRSGWAVLGGGALWLLAGAWDGPWTPRAWAQEEIRLAEGLSLAPDGSQVAFAWRGDLWLAPTRGGTARRLTSHPGNDRQPRLAPDGRRLAFTSNRSGVDQVYVMELPDGEPRVLTHHSEGSVCQGWFPDGTEVLAVGRRDHDHERPERFFRVPLAAGGRERLLLDEWGSDGALSPDGTQLAFVRHGTGWSRKGYRGSAAAQVWVADLKAGTFRRVSKGPHEERWPLWQPDGRHLWLVSEEGGTRNIVSVDLEHGSRACLTALEDDGTLFPSVSGDGRVFVFRRLFDVLCFEPGRDAAPALVRWVATGEPTVEALRREDLAKASQASFTADGREIAFAAGGDLWVMDTELREPRRVTDTPEEERDPVFSPDFQTLVFVSDRGGRTDLWQAARADGERWWWQNESFPLTRLTDDAQVEATPRFAPDGAALFYARAPGDLWTRPFSTGTPTRLVPAFDEPEYAISPDGRWLAYVAPDDDFNYDVWLLPVDLSRPAFNLSLHPDNEASPAWSPDGRLLAFTGRRWDQERDICYVWLRAEDAEKDARDRKLDKALEKMKGRKPKKGEGSQAAGATAPKAPAAPTEGSPPEEAQAEGGEKKPTPKDEKPVEVRIDFDGLEERIRRIEIPAADESDLVWSPDSKRLLFRAGVKGQVGLHTVEFPDELQPKLLTATAVTAPQWLKEGDQVVGLVEGVPTSVAVAGAKVTALPFRARRELDVGAFHKALLERAWQVLRDTWYDSRLNHRDGDALREKYAPMAALTRTPAELDHLADFLLGELNGSHLGFGMPNAGWTPPGWKVVTGHLGARLAPPDGRPGRLVRDVVRDTPAHESATRIRPGERLLAVGGIAIDDATDIEGLLTGEPEREVELRVADATGAERTLRLRPTTYAAVRTSLYEDDLERSRAQVTAASGGTLGYLHVKGMNWPSFQRFEEELYKVGHGKDGLLIDVRGNGGGFTADHLLTCLTQPRHATAVPRGGGPGYPQDRLVYAAWSKPIVVLIDQDSFSNAEIFAHAIRTLRRGRLVGVATAGGVISTGSTTLLGTATLRLPSRGWFLPDGRDMERNGCPPDIEVWPEPGDTARGVDRQLERAIHALTEDVKAFSARPQPARRYASETDGPPPGAPRR